MKISCIIHTRNSAATLGRALDSVAWTDEIVVVDMESTDGTREIAHARGCRLLSAPAGRRVDDIRQQFLAEAVHEWILVLDSDESLAADAKENIERLLREDGERVDAFAIPRFNVIAGQVMRGSGWYPAPQIRLFRKGKVRWPGGTHGVPQVTTGRLMELQPPSCLHIFHRNYDDLRHFIRKQLDYALCDDYDADPASFDFSDAIAGAYANLAMHGDRESDGDLSHALALVMAWDSVMRGLIRWDSLRPRPPLAPFAALPIAAERIPWWRIRLRKWLGRRHSTRFVLRSLHWWLGRLLPPLRRQ